MTVAQESFVNDQVNFIAGFGVTPTALPRAMAVTTNVASYELKSPENREGT